MVFCILSVTRRSACVVGPAWAPAAVSGALAYALACALGTCEAERFRGKLETREASAHERGFLTARETEAWSLSVQGGVFLGGLSGAVHV